MDTQGKTGNNRSLGQELFDVNDDDLDFKTDLTEEKINHITSLFETDLFFIKIGLKPLFKSYYEKYMRLMVSRKRQGRTEFVDVNKNKREELPLNMQGKLV